MKSTIGSQYVQYTFDGDGLKSPKTKKYKNDFVFTPPEVTQVLFDNETFEGDIIEPCCGEGHISEVIKKNGYLVNSSDKIDYGYGEVKDLFLITKKYSNIITNPPFTIQGKVKKHLLSITTGKLCLLWYVKNIGNEIESPSGKYLKTIYVFRERIPWVNISFGWLFAWYVWDKSHTGDTTIKYVSLKDVATRVQ